MSPPNHTVILFDLGGVLWDIGGPDPLGQASNGAIGPEEARVYWDRSEWLRRFDTGTCTPEEFAAGVIAELGLPVEPEQFLRHVAALSRGLMSGALSLLESLKDRYLVGCLSNNTEFFWKPLNEEADLRAVFHRLYLSYELGLRKPDAAIYEYALADLGVPPDRILYFDDREDCVAAARAIGLDVHQVGGVDDVRRVLTSLGILARSGTEP
jgi:putative hydrolase of the HAD superfamily